MPLGSAYPLTPKQKKVLDLISKLSRQNGGVPPSRRELAAQLQISSVATIQQHIEALERKGWLSRGDFGGARAIQISREPPITLPTASLEMTSAYVPLLGRIAAGSPIDVPASSEDYQKALQDGPKLEVPAHFLKLKNPVFALVIQGDSMQDEGLLDGDWALIEKRNDVKPGNIIAALLNGETTLKRFQPVKRQVTQERLKQKESHDPSIQAWLLPANKKYFPIPVRTTDRFMVQGILVGMMRSYEHS